MRTVLDKLNIYLYKSALILVGIIGILLIIVIKSETYREYELTSPLFIYTIAITTFQLSRLAGAILYQKSKNYIPYKPSDIGYFNFEPSVSFVIPCKNEEEAIEKTVRKCFAADCPKEKLEVIVVNDGSDDGTIDVLRRLSPEYENLRIVDWKVNRGKRFAMAEGFKQARGEIVVQLDSDSYIKPSSFRNLIVPFYKPDVGAVCAHADPENADKNWLTKMQAAYYFMSFRILKAAESSFFTVFCCSGCSSAYRKSVVNPIINDWLNEKFLGLPVTWGDDRALTNWVIKQGYKTIYTDEVQAYTICPDTFKKFLKQQIRWKKGWFVNSIFASKFVAKKEPFVAYSYFFPLILITLITPFMATRALIYNPIIAGVMPGYYFTGVFLIALIMTTYYRYVGRRNKYWPYMFVWSAVNLVFLSFILFYALVTIQNRKWGTR
jgi:hyaluronan synthase